MNDETTSNNDQHPLFLMREAINTFFGSLHEIDGMDPEIATIIQRLWDKGILGRDELLAALKKAREVGGQGAYENKN